MTIRHFIIIVTFCMFFPLKTYSETIPAHRFAQDDGSTHRPYMYSAQNSEKETTGGNAAGDTARDGEDASGTEAGTDEKKTPEKAKQIKPFVPSEKIPADQGVDFPYDI